MDTISLFEEYRLIERSETEVNGAWKGAHILLFFLAFVFGSFCTFCFHMLMYLFDEKCVLFPKLLSLTSMRHNVLYEFLPADKEISENLPVDFLSTQWVDKSACYLPTYVPLVSGIFGLVWTTMFLMCSTGSRTLTGLQRPWRVLPPVFLFSLAMGALCVYSSAVTHYGLNELCLKLGEITGSSTCTYTVNVATLASERRIRGVFQATRLTILSAWLHTACWLLSALLVVARVLLVVDFQLVRVNVKLHGNIDRLLERREKQIRTVSPDLCINDEGDPTVSRHSLSGSNTEVYFRNQNYYSYESIAENLPALPVAHSDILYVSVKTENTSEMSLVAEERNRLARLTAYQSVPKDKRFIVEILYDLVDMIDLPESRSLSRETLPSVSSYTLGKKDSDLLMITRQYGQELLSFKSSDSVTLDESKENVPIDSHEAEEIANEIRRTLQENLGEHLNLPMRPNTPTIAKRRERPEFESSMNITSEMMIALERNLSNSLDELENKVTAPHETEEKSVKKSNIKNIAVQTDKKQKIKNGAHKVQISESKTKNIYAKETSQSSTESDQEENKETQTPPKEKQD